MHCEQSSTDASLIERVRRDESKAWRELVDLYGPLVAHWCRKLGIREACVTDAVQDVFLAVLRSLAGYDAAQAAGGFRGWLWGITRHKCIDALRREARHPEPVGGTTAFTVVNNMPQPEQSLDEPTEAIEIQRLLHRAMSQVEREFEARTWEAFTRTTVDGVATAVVAQELGLSPAAVRQYRSRVLRRLRKQLGDLP